MSLLDFFKQKSPVAAADEDTNRRDVQGRTPLHDAVSSVRFEGSEDKADLPLADALLKAGADPNARDKEGRTPLHLAQDSDAAALLVGAGADIDATDNLDHGVTEGKSQSFEKTIEAARVQQEDIDPNAMRASMVQSVETFLDRMEVKNDEPAETLEPKAPSLDELYAALDNPEPMAPRVDKPRTNR